ncbi:MAG: pentapeptide repeat-containing protein [Kamptonema sp. SIO4C4]|nr:pentapeptide repeat-containing protein [Kamptonema sp. SIO4C4]
MTNSVFSKANLKSIDFRNSVLINTIFYKAKNIDKIRYDKPKNFESGASNYSLLSNEKIRKLLVSGDGENQSYVGLNLKGAYLVNANLSNAELRQADLSYVNLQGATVENTNFKQANLSQAILQDANLKDANLTETLALGTNFTGAYLTGACLEGWNIDHTTILERVDCQYVFLLEQPNANGHRERQPHDPDKCFAPGDFEKIYEEIINTVQILLKDGVNPEAFSAALGRIMVENPEITKDSIQGMQKKGDDVLLTIEVPEGTDKAQIERTFDEVYVAKLEAQAEAQRQYLQDFKEIALVLAKKQDQTTIAVNNENKMNSENQDIQTGDVKGNFAGSVGGNFDASGSALNIDNTNSTISNTINELPPTSEADEPGIKELLAQLQTAINAEPNLSEEDKAEALQQVQQLAEAGKDPKNSKGVAKNALTMLKGLIFGLPAAAKLMEECQKLLPSLAQLFGL